MGRGKEETSVVLPFVFLRALRAFVVQKLLASVFSASLRPLHRGIQWYLLVVLCTACTLNVTAPTATPVPTPTAIPSPTSTTVTSITPARGPVSEGVRLTGAEAWHAAGITGKGVKIGIIDGGFINYGQVLGNAKVTAKSFRGDELIADRVADGDTVHGTACAEIVHEMAPDAELYLAATDTSLSFLAALQWLVGTAKVSIITSSLGFYGDFPTDGSSDLAQAVDRAKAAGVFFVKSAGNFADQHYGATFTDTDNDGFHDFPGGKTKNGMIVKMQGDPFEIYLNWNDWKQPHVNYDLYLYNSAGQEAGRSDTDQTRSGKQPVEHITGTLPSGSYILKIKKVNPNDPNVAMNLIIRNATPELTTAEGSITVPGDARGAVAVAAINVKTDTVETYSSHGPTLDGRPKPEMGAPDRVSNTAYAAVGVSSFTGTSAAAPHVGGAAALYKQAFPDATSDAILAFLTARAGMPQGKDRGENITGSGRLSLGAPPNVTAGQPTPQPAGTARPTTSPPAATAIQRPAATATTATEIPRPAATVPAGVPRPGPLFTDDFSSPNSGLPAKGYGNKAYRVTPDASTLTVLAYPNPITAPNAIYEMQARKTGGANDGMIGLVVRRTDDKNELLFMIANDGVFNVLAKVNGSTRSLTGGWQTTGAVMTGGTNTLRVEATGDNFTFIVNGTVMTRITFADLGASGGFGFAAGGGQKTGSEITLTNYSVTAP